jgi:adenine deaminase
MRYLNGLQDFDYFALVTDDVMADDLEKRGHLNVVIREVIRQGLLPEKAIYASTFAPAQRMRLYDRGALSPGKLADFLILKDVESFEIHQVFKRGRLVQPSKVPGTFRSAGHFHFPDRFYQSVQIEPLTTDQFRVSTPIIKGKSTCRVMEVQEHTTYTKEIHKQIPVVDGMLQWQDAGICLVAVFERHGKSQTVGYGFATGACLKRGAAATTFAHDSHNLLVIGRSPEEMALAANTVIESQGGIAVVEGNTVKAHLPLPVAGLMAEEPVSTVGNTLSDAKHALVEQGYQHQNVIMSLSTLTLPVSPELKLSDLGLIHVPTRSFVSLIISEI